MEMNDLSRSEQAVFALRSLYRQYGYASYKMSRFEEYDLYVRNKDFLVSDQIITFSDRSGRLLALKPPMLVLSNGVEADEDYIFLCKKHNIPLLRSGDYTSSFISALSASV